MAKTALVLAALAALAAVSSFHRSMDMAICALLLGGVGAAALWFLVTWAVYEAAERYECVRPVENLKPYGQPIKQHKELADD